MRIEVLDINHHLLKEVKTLGKKNSSSLGHMPEGGFDDHARNKGILVAIEDEKLCGYLMFREVQRDNRVNIVHLCVISSKRGHGIAESLINHLIIKYKSSCYNSIELHCREDYHQANKLWSKAGFVAVNDKRSKSKAEHSLILWKYTLKQSFSIFSPQNYPATIVSALLDTNVILKLRDQEQTEHNNPLVLFSDSVISDAQYFVSDETYSETLRDLDYNRSKLTREYIQFFQRVSASSDSVITLSKELSSIITGRSVNDESDRRNIATCIICGIPYLLTFDTPLISKSESIESLYGVKILHPTQFVIELDSIKNKEYYNPTLLRGSMYHTISKIESAQIKDAYFSFWKQKEGEDNQIFKSILYNTINNSNGSIKVVKQDNSLIGIIGNIIVSNTMDVTIIRVAKIKQGKYLFMHLLSDIISTAILKEVSVIHISEKYLPTDWLDVVFYLGFTPSIYGFTKHLYNNVVNRNELGDIIQKDFKSDISNIESLSLFDIEKFLFPLKISDSDIPTYIIPIKPYWAQSLFDNFEASMSLFGVDTSKLWNIENVYFRSIRPDIEESHSRILWYVSDDRHSTRRKGIVASSYLNEVHTDEAKCLFERYKHYGVYEWSNIMDITNGVSSNPIKAIIFSHTELFRNVIPLNVIRNILRNKNITFQSPLKISQNDFLTLYSKRNNVY